MKKPLNESTFVIFFKQAIKMTVATALLALLFISCEKQTSSLVSHNKTFEVLNEKTNSSLQANAVHNTIYYSCGMQVNVFAPFENSANRYTFASIINGQQKRFGITTFGLINYLIPDKFSFEYAGYLDRSQTAKSWRIRRTDGKYLTTILGNGLEYADKLKGSHEARQIFLLSSLGNNVYKVLLPKLTVCNVVAMWYDIDLGNGIRIASFDYNSYQLNYKETKITMIVVPLSNI